MQSDEKGGKRLRLIILGHGSQAIPPSGRGAVESIIWEYTRRLRERGHSVEIINERPSRLAGPLLRTARTLRPHFIWSHHERMVPTANRIARFVGGLCVHTSHRPVTDIDGMDRYGIAMLKRGATAHRHISLTPEIMLLDKVLNPATRSILVPNGVDTKAFQRHEEGAPRAIYLGGISRRKRQVEVAQRLRDKDLPIDFVGPIDHADPETTAFKNNPNYLGEWTREQLHERLGTYSTLVLYSLAEAQPLVIGEAFAAGLSVVLSPESARNVDASEPFVRIAHSPDDLESLIRESLVTNHSLRNRIWKHAEESWDWESRVSIVEAQLNDWRSH